MTADHIIEKIREALEAGPYEGPWTVEEFQHDGRPCALIVSASETIIAEIRGYTDSCGNGENARFIAACNPQNIAVLLAEFDTRAVFEAAWKNQRDELIGQLEAAEAQRDALRKALAPFANANRIELVGIDGRCVYCTKAELYTARTLAGDNHE